MIRGARGVTHRAMPPARSRARRGFTLVEIVVTLVILAVMAAVAVPAFRSTRPLGDLDYSVNRLETLLRLARDSSVRTATPVTLVIDSASSLVWLTTSGSLEESGTSLELPIGVRLELTSARARFAFQPSGSAFPDSVFLVSSTGTRGVTLNPRTGHAIVF